MLDLLARPSRVCDGVPRRTVLRVGGLAALGITLPDVLRCSAGEPKAAKADACILVYLFGGPSQLDTFDLKPAAPSEVRGEFRPIPTNVPGVSICEHFRQLAQQMDKIAVVRSMHHLHPRHGYGLYYMFTGREHARPDLDAPPEPDDFPSLGSLVAKLQARQNDFPPAITLPRWNRFLDVPNEYAGELAGFLGKSYDPWLIKGDPKTAKFDVAGIDLPAGLSLARLSHRRDLLSLMADQVGRFSENQSVDARNSLYRQAFALVSSEQARQAFRLDQEPPAVHESYGPGPFEQGLLLARRLVEAGAKLVTVNWHDDGRDVKSPFWDTHKDNFSTLKEQLIPPLDRGLSALLVDLDQRGMLERTLVVVMGEFGRTPRIGRVVMNAATNSSGRDHWPFAYSILLAGGGVRGGQVYGASDRLAASVADAPVTPPDLVATVLSTLGVDLSSLIIDRLGRPQRVTLGRPVEGIF